MQILTAQGAKSRTRMFIGGGVYGVLMLIGALLLAFFLISDLANSKRPGDYLFLMFVGGAIAFIAVIFYMLVPIVIDRFDPEPWWALLAAFLWGAIVSCGFAGIINSFIGALGASIDPVLGDIMGSVVSAPIFEELFKGLLVALMYFFLRSEFDGVVDGVIYATFTALGFAAMENMLYYARAGMNSGGQLVFVVFLRGFLSPWCHPLFTSMTGIGFGIAREAKSTWVKIVAPVAGFGAAVLLHAAWNGTAQFAGLLTGSDAVAGVTMLLQLALFAVFMLAFTGLMIGLVVREGRIIRKNLADEVLIGTLTKEELELVCSPWGRLRAMFTKGGLRGRKFVGAAATLALKKWHTARAMEGKKMTVSMDFIVPLRQEIAKIRAEISGQAAPLAQPAAPQGYAVPGMPQYMPPAPGPGFRPAQPQAPTQPSAPQQPFQQPYPQPAQLPYQQPLQQQPFQQQPYPQQGYPQPPAAAPQPYPGPAQPQQPAWPQQPGPAVPPAGPGWPQGGGQPPGGGYHRP